MNDKSKKLMDELYEFLVVFDKKPVTEKDRISIPDESKWNELLSPAFRESHIFAKSDASALLIITSTHMSTDESPEFHVIEESINSPESNGEYAIMTKEEIEEMYGCTIIDRRISPEQAEAFDLMSLANAFVDALPEIKKLKKRSNKDRKESVDYFMSFILGFILLK